MVLMADDLPDLYVDGVTIAVSPFDVVIELTRKQLSSSGTDSPRRIGIVRMSHEHAKTVAIMLKSYLKAYEDQIGTAIPVHPALRSQLGISVNEDW